jgi:hypothetical protein
MDDTSLLGFWKWAYSDLRSNTVRPLLAEYLVGSALECLNELGRREWSAWDLEYQGKRLEVKSAGYIQSWPQSGPSKIVFGIAPAKNAWHHDTNTFLGPGPHADIYIFCLHEEQDENLARILDMDSWRFFIVPAAVLFEAMGAQKTISLRTLGSLAPRIQLNEIKGAIDTLIGPDKGVAKAVQSNTETLNDEE